MLSQRLLQNIRIQRRLIMTEKIMEQVVNQIKSTYNSTDCIRETLAKFWINGNIRALKLIDTDIEMEFTSDEDGINIFIINKQNNPSELSARGMGNTWVHIDENIRPIEGKYAFHEKTMFTHFRFTPTSGGVLLLLKLVDVCVDQVEKSK